MPKFKQYALMKSLCDGTIIGRLEIDEELAPYIDNFHKNSIPISLQSFTLEGDEEVKGFFMVMK